jgi:hypothetical protein
MYVVVDGDVEQVLRKPLFVLALVWNSTLVWRCARARHLVLDTDRMRNAPRTDERFVAAHMLLLMLAILVASASGTVARVVCDSRMLLPVGVDVFLRQCAGDWFACMYEFMHLRQVWLRY